MDVVNTEQRVDYDNSPFLIDLTEKVLEVRDGSYGRASTGETERYRLE